MPNPTTVEINCTTQEVIEIELTDEEVAEREVLAAEHQAQREAEETAAAAAKAAVLAKLGLTEEELRAALA